MVVPFRALQKDGWGDIDHKLVRSVHLRQCFWMTLVEVNPLFRLLSTYNLPLLSRNHLFLPLLMFGLYCFATKALDPYLWALGYS